MCSNPSLRYQEEAYSYNKVSLMHNDNDKKVSREDTKTLTRNKLCYVIKTPACILRTPGQSNLDR